MEFHDGSLRRFVKLWIATTIALFLLLVLASQRWPPLDVMLSSPWRATKQNSGNSNEESISSVKSSVIISSYCGSKKNWRDISIDTQRLNCAQQDGQSNFAGLADLLPKVATDDRTVIITSVNEAFARPGSLLGLFRESFFAGEKIDHFLDHLLVVAVDAMAYCHCRSVHRFCYLLPVTATSMNLSSASDFMSDAYVELVWTKLELQQGVLQLGYSFLFTDVDILWFRDPFRHIGLHADMATSCDVYSGDADDLNNWPNTGFYYVKSTNRTVEMLRRWRAARRRFPRDHEQTIFNHIKHELAGADSDLRIRVQFLDTAHFSGFCQLFRNDMARACTMHANCCVGMANKISDLRDVLGQWRNYTVMTPAEKKSKAAGRSFEWRVPANCGTPDKRPE